MTATSPTVEPARRFVELDLIGDDARGTASFLAQLVGPPGTPEATGTHIRGELGVRDVRPALGEHPGAGWVPIFLVDDVAAARHRAGAAVTVAEAPAGAVTYVVDEHGAWTGVRADLDGVHPLSILSTNTCEYWTPDAAATAKCLADLLDLQAVAVPGDPYSIHLLLDDDRVAANVLQIQPGQPIKPGWIAYLTVPDTDALVERAAAAGASVIVGPEDTPLDRFSVLADPHGQPFGIHTKHDVDPFETLGLARRPASAATEGAAR